VRTRTFKYKIYCYGEKVIEIRKRSCVCTESVEEEYPFLKEDKQVIKVQSPIFKSHFSIVHRGRSDILQQVMAAEIKSNIWKLRLILKNKL
jgi:hypothetical protein